MLPRLSKPSSWLTISSMVALHLIVSPWQAAKPALVRRIPSLAAPSTALGSRT